MPKNTIFVDAERLSAPARLKPIIIKDMKRITKFLVIAAVAASAAACAPAQKTAITAHRGFWNCEEAGYAQNSIKALEMAQVNQFWGSEFDVHMTRDLVLIVNHDNSIDGMKIWDHDFADFKDCRLKNGEKIPTLDQYLTQGEKSDKTVLVCELKSQGDKAHEDYMTDMAVKALQAHRLLDPSRVIFISFSMNICHRLAGLCPGFTVQYLGSELSPQEIANKGVNGIDFHFKTFTKNPDWLPQAKAIGMSSNAWTVDKEEDIKSMVDLGVDCITTNEPLRVRGIVGSKEQKVK